MNLNSKNTTGAKNNDLTDSQLDMYTEKIAQEQSFSASPQNLEGLRQLSEMSSLTPSTEKRNFEMPMKKSAQIRQGSIQVTPLELTFQDFLFDGPIQSQKTQKLMFKNQFSASLSLNLESSCQDLETNLVRMQIEPQTLTIAPFESAIARVTLKAKKMNTKMPSKIREHIKVVSEFFQQRVEVTIVPNQPVTDPNEQSLTGSNYIYDPNNESSLGSSRFSNAASSRRQVGGMTNALLRMRSLSKEIKDQKRRNFGRSQLGDSGLRESESVERPGSQLKDFFKTENQIHQTSQSTHQQSSLPPTIPKHAPSMDNTNQDEQDTFRGRQEVDCIKAKHNNMTASFNQQELENLEKHEQRPFFGQNSAIGGDLNIAELDDGSQKMIRDDLDTSNIEDGEDIQRSKHHNDELNFTDMTVSNNEMDGRDPNDQSLSLNQLEHSQFSYSKSNNKSHLLPPTSPNEMQLSSLRTEIKGYQKIISQQQEKIKEEVTRRVRVEEAQGTSKMGNEQAILGKIQQLLHKEEPNLEELMGLSLKHEKEKQAQKDQQVLQILKAKDREIQQQGEAIEAMKEQIDKLQEEKSMFSREKHSLQQSYNNACDEIKRLLGQLGTIRGGAQEEKPALTKQQIQENASQANQILELQLELEKMKSQLENRSEARGQDDVKAEENRILVQELERLELEKQEMITRTSHYEDSNSKLQEKLKQALLDNRRLAMALAEANQTKVSENNNSLQTGIFDSKESSGLTPSFVKHSVGSQTDLDMSQMANLEDVVTQQQLLISSNRGMLQNNSAILDDKYFSVATALQLKDSGVGSGSAGQNSAALAQPSHIDEPSARIFEDSEKVQRLESQVKSLKDELQRKQSEISQFTQLNSRSSECLLKEDLAKLCEYLRQQNLKLQAHSVAVQDLDELDRKVCTSIPGGTSTFGAIMRNEEVFNPYKTNLTATIDKPASQLEIFDFDEIIAENHELKQQLIAAGRLERPDNQLMRLQAQLEGRDHLIQQLREQLQETEKAFKQELAKILTYQKESNERIGMFGNTRRQDAQSESNQGERELRLAISKLQILFVQMQDQRTKSAQSDQQEYQTNEILIQQQNALKIASFTVMEQKKEILSLQTRLIHEECFRSAAVINRILAQRHQFLNVRIQFLQQEQAYRNKLFTDEKKALIEFYEKASVGLEEMVQAFEKRAERAQKIEQENHDLIIEQEQLRRSMKQKEYEFEYYKDSLVKQAEMDYDSRQKLKDEKIKAYFDSQVMKYLINNNNQNLSSFAGSSAGQVESDTIELTRQFCELQLQLDKQTQQIEQCKLEIRGYQQQVVAQQTENDQLQEELFQAKRSENANTLQDKSALTQFRVDRQVIDELKGDFLRVMDELSQKRLEIEDIKMYQVTNQFQSCFAKYEEALKAIERGLMTGHRIGSAAGDFNDFSDTATSIELRAQVELLQKQLIELRTQQMLETEEIKTNCEIEMMEEKRTLRRQKELLEKKFEGSQGHPDATSLVLENEKLQERNEELYAQIESLRTELRISEKRYEELRCSQYAQSEENQCLRDALSDLKNELCNPLIYQPDLMPEDSLESITKHAEITINKNQKQVRAKKGALGSKKGTGSLGSKGKTLQRMHSVESLEEDQISMMSTVNQALTSNNYLGSDKMSGASGQTTKGGGRLFTINPPLIVSKLIEAKVHEKKLLVQIQKSKHVEANSHQEIRKVLQEQARQNSQRGSSEELQGQLAEERLRRHDLEAKLRILELDALSCASRAENGEYKGNQDTAEPPKSDYALLVNTVIWLINKQVQGQSISANEPKSLTDKDITQVKDTDSVYKIIIFQLSKKLQRLQGNGEAASQISNFVPEGQQNQRIWYLELLESQLGGAETIVNKLIDFVKRLQVDIQGSLTSAAQIKATSLDLATNSKEACEEIKLLRHVTQLIRSDVDQIHLGNLTDQTPNPFSTTIQTQGVANSSSMIDLQNQLTITKKVKASLEQELIQLKKSLITQKDQLSTELRSLEDQRCSLLSKVQKLEKEFPLLKQENKTLKRELDSLRSQHKSLAKGAIEELDGKEKERSAAAKNQAISSKNMKRLQEDMNEWRRTTDENLRLKNAKIADLQKKTELLDKELGKIKAENSMLRKNQKEWLGSTTKQMEDQRDQLKIRVDQMEADKKKEIDAIREEKDIITKELEQVKLEFEAEERYKGQGLLAQYLGPDQKPQDEGSDIQAQFEQLNSKNKKLKKKLLEKDEKVKSLEAKEQEFQAKFRLVDETNQNLKEKCEESLQETRMKCLEVKAQEQTIKQLEHENNLLKAETRHQVKATEASANNFFGEVDTMRSAMTVLKNEKESMLLEIEKAKASESRWRQTVEQLKRDIDQMQQKVSIQYQDQSQKVALLEAQDETISVELKILRQENQAMKDDNKLLYDKVNEQEQELAEKEQQLRLNDMQSHDSKKQQKDLTNQIQMHLATIEQLQNEIRSQEIKKDRSLEDLAHRIEEIKDSRQSLVDLYDSQLQMVKLKLTEKQGQILNLKQNAKCVENKEKAEKEVDYQFQMTQRDALIKQLKKENSLQKSQIIKLKTKSTEQKQQIDKIQQSQMQSKQEKTRDNQRANTAIKGSKPTDISQVSQHQSSVLEEFEVLMSKAQQFNDLQQQMIQIQSHAAKTEGWNLVLMKQSSEQEQTINEQKEQIDELLEKGCKDQKTQKMIQQQSETLNKLKQSLKSQEAELQQLKQTWISPEKHQQEAQTTKNLQQTIKDLKEEVSRKKDLIQTMKQHKDNIDNEKKEQAAEITSLREENLKMSKQQRQALNSQTTLKQIKQDNEGLKQTISQLQSDAKSQAEKITKVKNESQRKDQIIKELKYNLSSLQEPERLDNPSTASQDELKQKMKELKQKHKVETEIKENQIRSLKLKIDQQEEIIKEIHIELESLKTGQPIQSEAEKQHKKDRNKIKKQQEVIKKSLATLRKLSCHLSDKSMSFSHQDDSKIKSLLDMSQKAGHKGKAEGELSKKQENDIDSYKKLYKDSVDILGVSLDELEEFMNPDRLSKNEQHSVDMILEKFKRLNEMEDIGQEISKKSHLHSLQVSDDIHQVQEYCIKLIDGLANIH